MNQDAMSHALARFNAALNQGDSTPPKAITLLNAPELHVFDIETIEHSTWDEYPFLKSLLTYGTPPDVTESSAWEAAIRWLLNALRNWNCREENSFNMLRALLCTISTLDSNGAGLSSVATYVKSSQLTAGLRHILESTEVATSFNDQRFPDFRQEIESFASSGNFERLWQRVRHIDIFPSSDFGAAVIFMYNADPVELADIIERRNDVLFSFMICTALETKAIDFASKVNNLVFKFVSVANFEQNRTSGSTQSLQHSFQTLLLQVAESVVDWAAWMQAFFRYPGNNSPLSVALGYILHQLSQEHWTAFFKAISLSYSHNFAAPVANILSPLAHSPNAGIESLMWETAYQVWLEWNYAEHDSECALFAPAACALDYPVAMYYASQQSHDRLVEESNLLEAIETIEQQWFNSVTELVTERNRLKSRLRLVQHGASIAQGSSQVLPPPIEPDADLYTQSRYHYHDFTTH